MTESGKRRYIWGTIALTILLVAVLLWPNGTTNTTSKPQQCAAADIETTSTSKPTTRQTTYHKRPAHTRETINWDSIYSQPKEFHSKYDDFKVELNSADTTDLKELRGIGSSFANRIIKYRNLLGGYYKKEQLKEVYGMTDALYEMIAPHIEVDASLLIGININLATLDELKRHPYLDYYLAKAMVRYREQYGPYNSKEELLDIALMDQPKYNQIEKYITL